MITIIEKWQTSGTLQGHAKGAAAAAPDAAVGPHLPRLTTVTTMEPVAAGSRANGQL